MSKRKLKKPVNYRGIDPSKCCANCHWLIWYKEKGGWCERSPSIEYSDGCGRENEFVCDLHKLRARP